MRGHGPTVGAPERSSVINIELVPSTPLSRHVAGQSAGKGKADAARDPPLAGRGFVIPACRLPWPSSSCSLGIYTQLVSFTATSTRIRQAPRDKMASSGQQYYELYRRSRYIALDHTMLNLHRKG